MSKPSQPEGERQRVPSPTGGGDSRCASLILKALGAAADGRRIGQVHPGIWEPPMLFAVVRHRRALRERPELALAFQAEREEYRAGQRFLREHLIQLPLRVLKDMDRDLERGVKDARREFARALREGDVYRPIEDREPVTFYAQNVAEVNAELAREGEDPLPAGTARVAHLLGVTHLLDAAVV